MTERTRIIVHFLLGAISGVAICVLCFFFSGGGHGWTSAMISCFSILTAPLAGIGWGARGTKLGRACGTLSLVMSIVGDFILMGSEGFSYVERVWRAMPVLVIAWVILFLGWQFVALMAALYPSKTPTG